MSAQLSANLSGSNKPRQKEQRSKERFAQAVCKGDLPPKNKPEVRKIKTSKVEASKVEASKAEAVKVNTSKAEAVKVKASSETEGDPEGGPLKCRQLQGVLTGSELESDEPENIQIKGDSKKTKPEPRTKTFQKKLERDPPSCNTEKADAINDILAYRAWPAGIKPDISNPSTEVGSNDKPTVMTNPLAMTVGKPVGDDDKPKVILDPAEFPVITGSCEIGGKDLVKPAHGAESWANFLAEFHKDAFTDDEVPTEASLKNI